MVNISVIMPVYNEKLYELKDSINSIINQTYKNFEFIIIDDNPKSKIIKSFLLKEANTDSRIKILFNKINLGSMTSANKGIKYSRGVYIARMDADDVANKNRLYYQLHFCTDNLLDFSTCRILPMINGHIIKQIFYNKTQIKQSKIKHLFSNIEVINDVVEGPTLFFKKYDAEKIGGYRNMLCEDCDLAIRMIIHNYKVGFLSMPLVYKRSRPNSLSNNNVNVLKVFVVIRLLTQFVKRTNFNRVIPLSYINFFVSNIRNKDYFYYKKFILASLKFKYNKNIINLFKRYFWASSSHLVRSRNVFVLKRKFFHMLLNTFSKLSIKKALKK